MFRENALALGVACSLSAFLLKVVQADLVLTGILCICAFLTTSVVAKADRLYPPGPTGWPVIRNLLQIPQEHPWLAYTAWADKFGDIIHLEALGDHLVVLNSAKAAKDLLESRSAIYSDRPSLTMAELSGLCVKIPMSPYNDKWRAQRKIVALSFNPGAVSHYQPVQELEARKLVRGIIRSPETLVSQTKTRIAAIIMRVTYGYTVKHDNDPMITIGFEAMENFGSATEPGRWMVNFIPQLRWMPRWMPGTSFLRLAENWRAVDDKASWLPYKWCKGRIDKGFMEGPCLVASVLEQLKGKMTGEDEASLVWAAASCFGGGLDTNMSTIFTFFLAMLHHPEVQAKAQAEIEAVVGSECLPSIADRPSLPFVRSIVAEVYRWFPAAPLGLPHALSQDDVYESYLLPKASIVVPNIWYILHDPTEFPQPNEFKPERFGGDDVKMRNVTDIAFGFGRRTCPGFHFAEGTIFAIVVTVLATCEVVPKLGQGGIPIIPAMDYTNDIIVFPKHIVCDIKPRSARSQELLEAWASQND
ncbi:putative monooxygenase [Fomitopsis serialis]|uniref:putative monooxygenase n=1 Tax=Fomitopsis serialis TaxID=139415 RepID=UPI0020089A79|nr:putative monooxygenase [Neoantrodia serialis]KAH9934293.1 putative monooxygenase [Neoantrodia serialis]